MTKVLVLYYSSWGHIEALAQAEAEGARDAGAEVTVKRVPELVPPQVAEASGYVLDQQAAIADPHVPGNWRGSRELTDVSVVEFMVREGEAEPSPSCSFQREAL